MTKRKDGRWCERVTIDGKQYSFYSREPNERKAQKEIERKIAEYKSRKGRHPFQQVASAWWSDYVARYGTSTTTNSTLSIYRKTVDHFGAMYIEDMEPCDITNWLECIASRGLTRKTISNYKNTCNLIFKWAIVHGILRDNVCDHITIPIGEPSSIRELPSDTDIRKVASHWDGFDFFGFLLLYTGLRREEALALEYEDCINNRIIVSKVARVEGNHLVIVPKTKTRAGAREIIILNKLAEHFPSGTGRIFHYINSKKQFVTQWHNYCKRYDLHLTPHQLRHAYATMLYEAGIDERAAQSLMGHSDIALTHAIYTHIRDARLDDVANQLNAFEW